MKKFENDECDDCQEEQIHFLQARKPQTNYIVVNDITQQSSAIFRDEFFRLENTPEVELIVIFVDSFGGDVYALNSMLSLMQTTLKKVATVCDSKAFSCGAVLLAAGDPGLRFMSPFAYSLIHQVSHEYYGRFSDIAVSTEHCSELNKKMFSSLDKFAKKKSGFFEKLLIKNNNADLYISAEDALSFGLIDQIGVPRLSVQRTNSIETKLINYSKK
jgi:ATP-dependent Clp protease protease subunit